MRALTRPTRGSARSLAGLALAALAAGCIALPVDHGALDQARAEVEQVRGEPRVRALAPAELDRAEVALHQAETAALAGAPAGHVDQLAYFATRQAALARAQALNRVARAETEALERALGPALARAPAAVGPMRPSASAAFAAAVAEGISPELVLSLSEPPFDAAEPGGETEQELERIVTQLRGEPGRPVSIEADFDLPDPAARTAIERRIERIRGALLRGGIEPARIIVRASAPPEDPAPTGSDRPAPP
jgi:Domain of unknown function (DUF4398)